jgi:hypothetical protein
MNTGLENEPDNPVPWLRQGRFVLSCGDCPDDDFAGSNVFVCKVFDLDAIGFVEECVLRGAYALRLRTPILIPAIRPRRESR